MQYYRYSATELELRELPKGELRLGGFERTENPKDADLFVVPCDLKYVSDAQIRKLPYLKGNEQRHVFFSISDQPKRTLGLPAIIFRADSNKGIMAGDPTTISWPWPVNPKRDIDAYVPLLPTGFTYDICFVGWNSTPLTAQACQSVQQYPGLASFVQMSNTFYGTWESEGNQEKIVGMRNLFLARMQESRLSLCARSIKEGVVRYRFYEALAMGRIPVHLNDRTVLPFADRIDYERCSIHVPEKDVPRLGAILRAWLDEHSDADIVERGAYGRKMWEEYMAGEKWDMLFGWCAKERLAGRM